MAELYGLAEHGLELGSEIWQYLFTVFLSPEMIILQDDFFNEELQWYGLVLCQIKVEVFLDEFDSLLMNFSCSLALMRAALTPIC